MEGEIVGGFGLDCCFAGLVFLFCGCVVVDLEGELTTWGRDQLDYVDQSVEVYVEDRGYLCLRLRC